MRRATFALPAHKNVVPAFGISTHQGDKHLAFIFDTILPSCKRVTCPVHDFGAALVPHWEKGQRTSHSAFVAVESIEDQTLSEKKKTMQVLAHCILTKAKHH